VPALFDPPPRASILEKLEAYAAYLADRDGSPDFTRRTLSRREERIAAYESAGACFDGPFDAVLFDRQHRRYDVAVETPPEMLLLLCFVKINANEAYGVERVLARPVRDDRLVDRIERLLLLEEGYHTRLLLSAAPLFGVAVGEPAAPVATTRALVAGISRLPEAAARPVTLAAEAIGILTFLRALDACRRVLRDRPELRDAMEARLVEVLVDEVGHLSFNRLAAHTGTFAALRALVPAVAVATRGALLEAEQLGILPVPVGQAWSFDADALPEEVRRRAFIA
jgi:hypothetical protein